MKVIKQKYNDDEQRFDIATHAAEFLESNSSGAVMTKILLATVAVGGVVCAGAVAPGVIKAVEGCRHYSGRGRRLKSRSVQSNISRFKREGLIQLRENEDGTVTVLLADKGKQYVHDFTGGLRIRKPKIWDRKWRVVIFDIPVKKNSEGQILVRKLKEFGFRQIQKSVWIHPYKCEDEVLFVVKQLHVDRYVEILTVRKMLHEKKWRKLYFQSTKRACKE